MAQSYKVFIGGSVLVFGTGAEIEAVSGKLIQAPKRSAWPSIISMLEIGPMQVYVKGDAADNWENFASHFKLIEAAGGLVRNGMGHWLFIHRNGMWDLPKGKLEKGETIGNCAVREVAEECGIQEPMIIRPLSPTYHTYELNGTRILKRTHWFLMESSDEAELVPQAEEGISEVRWVATTEAQKLAETSFGAIQEVVTEGLK